MTDYYAQLLRPMSKERQSDHLLKVSRTFALTIPMLPSDLSDVIANAYLLCRIADTMEDDPIVIPEVKIKWLTEFASCARTDFKDIVKLYELRTQAISLLKEGAVPEEYALMQEMTQACGRCLTFHHRVQRIICQGVAILSDGMAGHLQSLKIDDLDDVDAYCYSVAGVVGELLSRLFAFHSKNLENEDFYALSVSFGEGLQLTNILKDRFKDEEERHSTFLPQPEEGKEAEQIAYYCAITQGHLDDARDFIKMIPRLDCGVRLFCLLNIIMASLTLKRILKYPQGPGSKLKITRRQVKCCTVLCALLCRFNAGVSLLTKISSLGSKRIRRDPKALKAKVSRWKDL